MPRKNHVYDYDLIVIGSGAGGGVAAHIAAGKGKRVAIIEQEKLGGECPNYGCIPTKALLRAAELYESAKEADKFGIKVSALNFNYSSIKKWKDLAVERTGTEDGEQAFASEGITVIRGHAHFISDHEVSTGRRRFTARKFLISTGTRDFVPPIEGLEDVGYIGYREAIDLSKPLKSVFIIGGGAIGCEFAELFATFGTKVHIAEFLPNLLGKEDPEVGELIGAVFEQQRGIQVHTGTKVVKIEKKSNKKVVHYETDGQAFSTQVDEIMVATGKLANVDLGLENAGVDYEARGIHVNEFMQTTNPNIYAAGDVTGKYMFTHVASYQSRIAAHNMFTIKRNYARADYHAVPRCVFVTPEAASVGITEAEAKERGWTTKVGLAPVSVIGRSNVTNKDIGFVKVIVNDKGVLVGASMVAPHAGEAIHELTLAIQHGLTAQDVTNTIHAFPTWSEAVRVACAKVA
jgi:pyruvate/2-oxoglutarate dehydrogenase complex dihydrolipoamide dehydrogenase (E3) component